MSKHAKEGHLSDDRFPKVRLSLSQARTPSSCASFRYDVPFPTYKGVTLGPIPPIAARSGSHPAEFFHPPPEGGGESPASRSQLPTMDSSTPAFGVKLKQAGCLLAVEFSNACALLFGFSDAKLNKERIAILTLESIMQRCKSPASTRAVIKNGSGIIQFSLDTRAESNPDGVTLTGESTVVLLRGYLESVADRGRSVPGAVKTSLIAWYAALGAPWPIDNPLVCADAQVESNQVPKHDPPMKLDTIEKPDALAVNVEITPFKRVCAPGIQLITYTSLRFSDVQRLRILEVNDDSIRGTLLQSKTKKPHGIPWPWACPRMGASGSTEWATPLIELRVAQEKLNGSRHSCVFPCLNHRWGLEEAEPAAYSPTRRKLALLRAGLNGPDRETYTLHPPRTFCHPRRPK